MAKWEFAVAIKDEADLKSGHKRKKEGDLIAVKPYPWKWGKMEVKEYLIVVVDGLTEKEAHEKCIPHYDGDGTWGKATMKDGKLTVTKNKVLAKRKHKIDFTSLPAMDMAKVTNPKVNYQPLKTKVMSKSIIQDKAVSVPK